MASFQRAAELQVLLQGVPLPATRQELIEYASKQSDGASFERELERLPDREFGSLDEVGEELAAVQPDQRRRRPRPPQPETGVPPGGEAYTDASSEPGAVRVEGPGG
jgi:Protein of unknown function (DUF2795)